MTITQLEELLNNKNLKSYRSQKILKGTDNGGMVLTLLPVGDDQHWIGMLTAYDKDGLKSENAVSFNLFMRIVNELENVLADYRVSQITGKLFGWKPSIAIKQFLYNKKVHRLFFLEESHVLSFLKEYTEPSRSEKRTKELVDVVVLIG